LKVLRFNRPINQKKQEKESEGDRVKSVAASAGCREADKNWGTTNHIKRMKKETTPF